MFFWCNKWYWYGTWNVFYQETSNKTKNFWDLQDWITIWKTNGWKNSILRITFICSQTDFPNFWSISFWFSGFVSTFFYFCVMISVSAGVKKSWSFSFNLINLDNSRAAWHLSRVPWFSWRALNTLVIIDILTLKQNKAI